MLLWLCFDRVFELVALIRYQHARRLCPVHIGLTAEEDLRESVALNLGVSTFMIGRYSDHLHDLAERYWFLCLLLVMWSALMK